MDLINNRINQLQKPLIKTVLYSIHEDQEAMAMFSKLLIKFIKIKSYKETLERDNKLNYDLRSYCMQCYVFLSDEVHVTSLQYIEWQ